MFRGPTCSKGLIFRHSFGDHPLNVHGSRRSRLTPPCRSLGELATKASMADYFPGAGRWDLFQGWEIRSPKIQQRVRLVSSVLPTCLPEAFVLGKENQVFPCSTRQVAKVAGGWRESSGHFCLTLKVMCPRPAADKAQPFWEPRLT